MQIRNKVKCYKMDFLNNHNDLKRDEKLLKRVTFPKLDLVIRLFYNNNSFNKSNVINQMRIFMQNLHFFISCVNSMNAK